jgi:hypothetical protein
MAKIFPDPEESKNEVSPNIHIIAPNIHTMRSRCEARTHNIYHISFWYANTYKDHFLQVLVLRSPQRASLSVSTPFPSSVPMLSGICWAQVCVHMRVLIIHPAGVFIAHFYAVDATCVHASRQTYPCASVFSSRASICAKKNQYSDKFHQSY